MPTIRVHFAWAAGAMLSAATAAPAQAACYPMAGIEPLSSRSPLFLERIVPRRGVPETWSKKVDAEGV